MFSKACEYGIRAMIYISDQSTRGGRASVRDVARAIDSPEAFTAKILQSLSNSDIIESKKGPSGGYEVSEAQKGFISLLHIVEAIDGDKTYHGCGLGLAACDEDHPCPIHHKYKMIRDELKSMLATTTIDQLAKDLHVGSAFLKV